MALITLARQAQLGQSLKKKRDHAIDQLGVGKSYFQAISESSALTSAMREFHNSMYLSGVYSILEGFLADLATEVLLCFPEKLKNSDIKLKDVFIGTSALLQEAVEKQIDQLFYQRFDSTVEALSAFFTNTAFAHSSKDDVTELKATRDIYLHNAGIINDAYHRKAGPKARQANLHTKKLPLDDSYLMNATESTIRFVTAFYDHGPKGMETFGRVKAFEVMWNETGLNSVMSFAAAWSVDEGADMARPTDKGLQWGWSHYEKYLYDFFLLISIYNSRVRTSELRDALLRWPSTTQIGQVIIGWLDAPFYF